MNVELQQSLDDDFYTEPIEDGDGHANASTIVERAAVFESRIVQGKAASCIDIAQKTFWDQAEARNSIMARDTCIAGTSVTVR